MQSYGGDCPILQKSGVGCGVYTTYPLLKNFKKNFKKKFGIVIYYLYICIKYEYMIIRYNPTNTDIILSIDLGLLNKEQYIYITNVGINTIMKHPLYNEVKSLLQSKDMYNQILGIEILMNYET